MNDLFPMPLLDQLEDAGVVAGFSVDRPQDAVPIVEALLSGGVKAIELTLRTPAGLEAVGAISEAAPEILLGVGTILTPAQAHEARDAGAHFGVAPGFNPRVVRAAVEAGLPFAPGVATPSELEGALELGANFLKLFPAGPLGGVEYLRSLAAPYKHLGVRFFPLGGLNAGNMHEYLREPAVAAIGGSWIVQDKHVAEGDWAAIATSAAEARYVLSELRKDKAVGKQPIQDANGSRPAVATGD